MGDCALRCAQVPDAPGQGAGVDTADADQALGFEPGVEMLCGPPVGRLGHVCPKHASARSGRERFDILGVGTGVADVRKGKGDDLPGVRRIGQYLLVPGDGRIETNLADRRSRCARAAAPKHRAVRQYQCRIGALWFFNRRRICLRGLPARVFSPRWRGFFGRFRHR